MGPRNRVDTYMLIARKKNLQRRSPKLKPFKYSLGVLLIVSIPQQMARKNAIIKFNEIDRSCKLYDSTLLVSNALHITTKERVMYSYTHITVSTMLCINISLATEIRRFSRICAPHTQHHDERQARRQHNHLDPAFILVVA